MVGDSFRVLKRVLLKIFHVPANKIFSGLRQEWKHI